MHILLALAVPSAAVALDVLAFMREWAWESPTTMNGGTLSWGSVGVNMSG